MEEIEPTDVEIFVITNGRGTFEYVIRSLDDQVVKRKVTVIRGMKWVDALNMCAEKCQCSYFMRIDDDMLLHPYTVAYYIHRIPRIKKHKGGVFYCRLWEDWSHKPVGGVRMYLRKAALKVKFRASKLGKVDKIFPHDIKKHGWRRIKDSSIVAIHALASKEDQIRYRNLWRDYNAHISKREFAKTFDNRIHKSRKTVVQQYKLINKIPKLNKKYKSKKFVSFIEKHKLEIN